jgi:dipeptidyl aminopeptidase/acylaminoacyl peptidase
LTVPDSEQVDSRFPVIIFNHGYIPPQEYKTTERYVAYVDAFAKRGYIVFKPDYRGHGNSEGKPSGAYSSPNYTIDVLNAISSIKRYFRAEPSLIGMWGHSMGGQITLRSMVVTKDVKVGVIWAGVVAPFYDIFNNWRHGKRPGLTPQPTHTPNPIELNKEYWNMISPNSFLSDLSGPLQLHHGTADDTVPIAFSETLYRQVKASGGVVEFYTYEGDNHNIANNFSLAMYRSLAYFDRYLKPSTPNKKQ